MIAETTLRPHAVAGPTQTNRAQYLPAVARTLLGSIFFVFGLNAFLHFLPQPSGPIPEGAAAFGAALLKTRYMFPLIKGTEVVAGTLLLSNRFVPLALAIIAPVIVNIVAFHFFLAPSGLGLAAVLFVLESFLAWTYRGAFRAVIASRAAPELRS